MNEIVLYDFWRSSASYRVRIALALKGLAYRAIATSLVSAEHKTDEYMQVNPQGLVPTLCINGNILTQSLAIIEYLDACYPEPRLIPVDPIARSHVMAQALVIAADIHPVNNLRILQYLKMKMGQDQEAVDNWYRHWIVEGFAALEVAAPEQGLFGGGTPNLADVFLVPQMYNARRYEAELVDFPRLVRIDAALTSLPAFLDAHPDRHNPG